MSDDAVAVEVSARVADAIKLFTFLGRAQELLAKPVRHVTAYEEVTWLGDLPDHPALNSAHRLTDLTSDQPLLTAKRVPKVAPPSVPAPLTDWIDGATDHPDTPPTLRSAIFVSQDIDSGTVADRVAHDEFDDEDSEPSVSHRVELADVHQVSATFDDWLRTWSSWADGELVDLEARKIYQSLFSAQLAVTDHAEEFELVVGVGCLAWTPEGHDGVLRHLLTAPISIGLDDDTGTITVVVEQSIDAMSVELDMLDPELVTSPEKIDEIKMLARDYEGHVLDQQGVGNICRRLVHRLDASGSYDEEAIDKPTGLGPRAHFAPALILRRRTNKGLVDIYKNIVSQIRESNDVPTGIIPLLDPDHVPHTETDSQPGAIVQLEEELFLPLPVNDKQMKVVERVASTAQTLVQGPPGTGKTHTAAVLVSHLLAQGKRVLITAHTERALYEVRDKLPAAIQPLAVSIIGKSKSDMSDLRLAVEQISTRASEFDGQISQAKIDDLVARIDRLRRERSEIFTKLLQARESEIETHSVGAQEGSLASIALNRLEQEDLLGWIAEFSVDSAEGGPPVSNDEVRRWHAYLLDADLAADEPESRARLASLDGIPGPEAFGELVRHDSAASSAVDRHSDLMSHEAFGFVQSLDLPVREELRERVGALADEAAALENRRESWMNDALTDIRSGRGSAWVGRRREISRIIEQAEPVISRIGVTTVVEIRDGNIDVHLAQAAALKAHLESGGKIKTLSDGTPKIGALAPKVVKSAEHFFAVVRVDGMPATTGEQLATFATWIQATRLLEAMDRAWPESVTIPHEDTMREELQWHLTEVEQLDHVLALGERLEQERVWLKQNHLPPPDWNDLQAIRRYADLVEAAAAQDTATAARTPLAQLVDLLRTETNWPDAPECFRDLLEATIELQVEKYVGAYERLRRLRHVAEMTTDRDDVAARLAARASRLLEAVSTIPDDEQWASRWGTFEQAWEWDRVGRWIRDQDSVDVNSLQYQLTLVERQIRAEVERLAAERAWAHAVGPARLSGRSRADLTQYSQLVTRLGKGTGKYAAKQRAEIKNAMDRCRPAVPVWIMPLYRIAEQLRVEPDLYDVVIVDEASQAGIEATFLQYLAPKIVVIGDDKQVSPAAVGVDQQKLRDLANQYLSHDAYKSSWQDPKQSLFDAAKLRYGSAIALTEHRRCVPEIIGFSNRIAYEPEGIRLVPVRQFGADRLDPIKLVHVRDGYEATNKTNPAEADAIVDQILKCFADPAYDGATFGVISLLGKQQAQLIEHKLIDLVPQEEWTSRQLRCGDATDFQGSERNVMFLSMVKGVDPEKRIFPLTRLADVQRFNVAASRAKDQMWVIHSMSKEILTNPEDMRHQLLEYCYGVASRLTSKVDGAVDIVVPEDHRVAPFDSLFEQRVFNRIIERGFTVVPQFDAHGYKIDLVVVGAKGRLAVECDGDYWHGPDVYKQDLSRQRDLERCDWKFFRIRESVFYADKAAALAALWKRLDELEIRPTGWTEPADLSEADLPPDVEPDTEDPHHNDASTLGDLEEVEPRPEKRVRFESDDPRRVETRPDEADLSDSQTPETAKSPNSLSPTRQPDQDSDPDQPEPHLGGRHRALHEEITTLQPVSGKFPDANESQPDRGTALNPDKRLSLHPTQVPDPPLADDGDTSDGGSLTRYHEFTDPLRPVGDDSVGNTADNLVRIVAAEGPVLGHRLHIAYVRSGGGQRVGKEIARHLNRALMIAEDRGTIVSDNPLNEPGLKPKTFRLPTQPPVIVRTLGPRSINQVPITELAALVNQVSADDPYADEKAVCRNVLSLLGLKRLTENTQEVLRTAMTFAGRPY